MRRRAFPPDRSLVTVAVVHNTVKEYRIAHDTRPRLNEEIRAPLIRVIGDKGEQLGVMSPRDAMRIAAERQLDLIEIAPAATPPVCKIVEYGKFRYEHQKREKQSHKTVHVQQLKEVRLRPNIDEHDIAFKARHVQEFIHEGHKVKITVVFRGREMAFKPRGEAVLRSFVTKIGDGARIEAEVRMEGNRMSVLLGPAPSARRPGKDGKEAPANVVSPAAEKSANA